MKVLAVAVPGAGHLNPLLPLVGELVGGGDDVVVAAAEDPGGVVAAAGAEFRRVGHGEMHWFDTLRSRVRGFPGDGLPPGRINHYFFPRLFGEIATADMIDDVVDLGREVAPDLVIFETYALAGPLAADLLGVPAAHHLISPLPPTEVLDLGNDAVSPIWRSFGRDAPGFAGVYRDLTIEVTPRSLETGTVPSGETLRMRPTPAPLSPPSPRKPPIVYVTLGTAFPNPEVFRAALDGLADLPVEVVLTTGAGGDPAALGSPPENARVERYIAQAELLPRCSAVTHHGGSGTMFGALAHGLPQVVVPQGADNFINAGLVARAGAGVVLGPDAVSAGAIGEAVRTVLADPSYPEAARRIAAEVAAMPGPADVAAALRGRVGTGLSRRPGS